MIRASGFRAFIPVFGFSPDLAVGLQTLGACMAEVALWMHACISAWTSTYRVQRHRTVQSRCLSGPECDWGLIMIEKDNYSHYAKYSIHSGFILARKGEYLSLYQSGADTASTICVLCTMLLQETRELLYSTPYSVTKVLLGLIFWLLWGLSATYSRPYVCILMCAHMYPKCMLMYS